MMAMDSSMLEFLFTPSTVLVTVATGLTASWLMSYRKPPGSPPGPRRIPFLGTIAFSDDKDQFMSDLTKMKNQYGNIVSFYYGNKFAVVLNNYELVKEAFVTKGVVSAGRPDDPRNAALNPHYPQRMGIIDAPYSEEWKRQRNTALNILRNLGWGKSVIQERIKEESEIMIACLRETKGKQYDPSHLVGVSVANIICSLLFGKRYNHDDEEFQELLDAVAGILRSFVGDSDAVFVPILQIFPSYKKAMKELNKYGDKLKSFYKKKIEEGKTRLIKEIEHEDFVTCYLSEIKSENSKISEDWLIQLISDFFIAGAETTATTLKWAFLYMSLHPEVQSKIQAEIDSVFGKEYREFTLADRERIPYTDATISEIQRITSIVPIGIPHETTADVELGGYKIPKGTEIWGNLYEVMHDPKVWPEPDTFKPERFLSENGAEFVRREQNVPFSMGRRTCLGEQLARQELFIFFTSVLHSFTITVPDGHPKPTTTALFDFVNKPQTYQVQFHHRL